MRRKSTTKKRFIMTLVLKKMKKLFMIWEDGESVGMSQRPRYIAIVTTIASALGCSPPVPVTGYWFLLIDRIALVLCLASQTTASILFSGGVVDPQVELQILRSVTKV
jgi:hypothetical protein